VPTALRITAATLAAVAAHALADHPREAVGLLGRAGEVDAVTRAWPLVNERTSHAATGFLVRPEAFAAAERGLRDAGLRPGGLYHSHAGRDAAYSTVDSRGAALGLPQLIVSVRGGAVVGARAWAARADRRGMDEMALDVLDGAR